MVSPSRLAGAHFGQRLGNVNRSASPVSSGEDFADALDRSTLLLTFRTGSTKEVFVNDTENAVLLTIFLRHQQDKNLGEINAKLEETGFWKRFPPPGVEVVSWYVMMGIGQVVTLRVPPQRLREVNLAIEQTAWGAFATDFYPTYDFRPVWENIKAKQES